mmetsp:Transcript_39991/g.124607  ORF Transcript_39991/g.124607 Transcript_39991/m.124607 type:complete len:353 (+) Transcript_39991:499-1557(+)
MALQADRVLVHRCARQRVPRVLLRPHMGLRREAAPHRRRRAPLGGQEQPGHVRHRRGQRGVRGLRRALLGTGPPRRGTCRRAPLPGRPRRRGVLGALRRGLCASRPAPLRGWTLEPLLRLPRTAVHVRGPAGVRPGAPRAAGGRRPGARSPRRGSRGRRQCHRQRHGDGPRDHDHDHCHDGIPRDPDRDGRRQAAEPGRRRRDSGCGPPRRRRRGRRQRRDDGHRHSFFNEHHLHGHGHFNEHHLYDHGHDHHQDEHGDGAARAALGRARLPQREPAAGRRGRRRREGLRGARLPERRGLRLHLHGPGLRRRGFPGLPGRRLGGRGREPHRLPRPPRQLAAAPARRHLRGAR